MNATVTTHAPASLHVSRAAWRMVTVAAFIAPIVALVAWTFVSPRWLAAIGIALTLFFALKLATLRGHWRAAPLHRLFSYVTLWPGMNAETFLRRALPPPPHPPIEELVFALGKFGFGLAMAAWVTVHAFTWPVWWVGSVGILSIIVVAHFGLFHVLSWMWRRAGIVAPPLMRAPIAACSLAEFWGVRWNTAFTTLARRFILRPLARTAGVRGAGLLVFLASGVVHDIAISLPAGGGWGWPTLYFLFQAVGFAVEKTAAGRRCGFGAGIRGWLWTFLFTVVPLPLLFHAPLLERVVVPLFRFLKEAL
jgi:hypothetical protein